MTPLDIKPGDAVRWWPDGHDDMGRAIVDRYIDGTVTALHPTWIKITGHHGFAERYRWPWLVPTLGHAVDTSISPGTIQGLNPAGYRPARIDWGKLQKQKSADPAVPWVTPVVYEDLPAPEFTPPQPVPASTYAAIEDLVRCTHEAMGMPADLFRGVDRAASPERLSGATLAGQRRADGFDQHQVDAAKAALLAPAPPRYPRAR